MKNPRNWGNKLFSLIVRGRTLSTAEFIDNRDLQDIKFTVFQLEKFSIANY